MPKLVIKHNDDVYEISELTISQLKELLPKNGNSSKVETHIPDHHQRFPRLDPAKGPYYSDFYKSISSRGRKFLETLKQNPDGIEANKLAVTIGLKNGNQLGGLAGGGLAKIAKKCGVDLDMLYSSEAKFENGVRTRIYRPETNIGLVK